MGPGEDGMGFPTIGLGFAYGPHPLLGMRGPALPRTHSSHRIEKQMLIHTLFPCTSQHYLEEASLTPLPSYLTVQRHPYKPIHQPLSGSPNPLHHTRTHETRYSLSDQFATQKSMNHVTADLLCSNLASQAGRQIQQGFLLFLGQIMPFCVAYKLLYYLMEFLQTHLHSS